MIGLDTNVLVRYFAQDDPLQNPQAQALIDSLTKDEPGWVSVTTIVELVWVVTQRLKRDRQTMTDILNHLLSREEIAVEQLELMERALQRYIKGNADFADCLIAVSASAAGCSRTVTFDRIAARDAGMELIV